MRFAMMFLGNSGGYRCDAKHRGRLNVFFLATALAGVVLLAASWLGVAADTPRATDTARDGWTTACPRDEIRPDFTHDAKGGPDGKDCFSIKADQRQGLDGCWKKAFPVTGGKHSHFEASFQAKGVALPVRPIDT